ncbi:MAG: GWxTD domain-containing protein [Bryobacteraceae bacterium]
MNIALTSALLHFIWQGAAIACALAIAMNFVKSARARYGLACVALLAMPAAFAITFEIALPPRPLPMRVPVFFTIPPTLGSGTGQASSPPAPFDPIPLWMAGVALLYGYRFVGWFAAQRLRRRGVCAAPQHWRERLAELSTKLRLTRPVVLLESALAETPITIGIWKPVILLPLGLLAGLPNAQVEAILLHELAHIRRHDYLVNLLQALVEGLLFYHPAVWWVSRTIRREREMCCDDIASEASGDVLTYTRALAALEAKRVRVPLLAATGGPLMLRIQRLLDRQTPVSNAAPTLVFLLLATGAALFAFQPEPSPAPQPTPAPFAPDPEPQATPAPAPGPPAAPQRPVGTPQADTTQDESTAGQIRRLLQQLELEASYRKWLNEEVVWIISPAERAAFSRLQTEEERQMFIVQFWLRRDPTPDTQANEYQEEHYRRIAWSNDHFAAVIPGWKTDRGMVYIKFGAPDEKEEHPANGTTSPYERWRYRYLEGVGNDVILEFVDSNRNGTYRMTWDHNDKDAVLRVPPAGLTLYEQMELVNKSDRPSLPEKTAATNSTNLFERMRRFVEIRPRPTN